MELLYRNEHLSCFNYQKGEDSTFEIVKLSEGERIEKQVKHIEIIFVIEGQFKYFTGKSPQTDITRGKMILATPGSDLRVVAESDLSLLICRPKEHIQICDCQGLKTLNKQNKYTALKHLNILDMNEMLWNYSTQLMECITDGLRCHFYFEVKVKELLYLIGIFYTKEQQADFLSPLLGNDSAFMIFVYDNYRKVKTVQELVSLSEYSDSGFKKKFAKIFGTSPSEWLRSQTATQVQFDLYNSPLTIKELADKYKFSSVAHFTTFCHNNFGKPPGQIRREIAKKEGGAQKCFRP